MPQHPASASPFLEVRVRDLATEPTLRGLCVGYENGKWRESEFARHVIEWLPEFALDVKEREDIGHHNCIRLAAKAAQSIYSSDKYKSRGEFGEVLLHLILRQECKSTPAISKLYFKSASNDTVKGFDAVHVVGSSPNLELWLGEVKFYKNIATAIRSVAAELHEHVSAGYLRKEFLWIGNKLNPQDAHSAAIHRLLDRNNSLDKIFRRLCFPVLLTYESFCIAKHASATAAYQAAFEAEVRTHYLSFCARGLPKKIRIHLFLLPIKSKDSLTKELHLRLKKCQEL